MRFTVKKSIYLIVLLKKNKMISISNIQISFFCLFLVLGSVKSHQIATNNQSSAFEVKRNRTFRTWKYAQQVVMVLMKTEQSSWKHKN
jgi:TRAP-type C4-dicarboxylate transport system permease small subunit